MRPNDSAAPVPAKAAPSELAWAIQRIEQSRDIHLAWVEHLRSTEPCDRCPPDIGHSVGDVEHHLSVAADYERILAALSAAPPEPLIGGEGPAVPASQWYAAMRASGCVEWPDKDGEICVWPDLASLIAHVRAEAAATSEAAALVRLAAIVEDVEAPALHAIVPENWIARWYIALATEVLNLRDAAIPENPEACGALVQLSPAASGQCYLAKGHDGDCRPARPIPPHVPGWKP